MERMERAQNMIIGVDVDGTLFDGVQVAPVAVRALQRAKDWGHLLVVVSGRRWEDLPDVLGDVLELFDVVVGEEGAVIAEVRTREVRLLADPIDPRLVAALEEAHVASLAVGRCVVGAPVEFAAEMATARDSVGANLRLVTNKASVALVPVGCDKASGLRAAIDMLHADGAPIVAIGDAENDLPMFAMATHTVAVANADDSVRRAGIVLTTASFGEGVAEGLNRVLDDLADLAGGRGQDDSGVTARGPAATG